MEEKKTKEVKMQPAQGKDKPQKLTYEQLNNACQQLFQQNQYLMKQLKEVNMENAFRRLDYLFKVVEFSREFGDADFAGSCIDEIKEALTIKDEPKKDTSKK